MQRVRKIGVIESIIFSNKQNDLGWNDCCFSAVKMAEFFCAKKRAAISSAAVENSCYRRDRAFLKGNGLAYCSVSHFHEATSGMSFPSDRI